MTKDHHHLWTNMNQYIQYAFLQAARLMSTVVRQASGSSGPQIAACSLARCCVWEVWCGGDRVSKMMRCVRVSAYVTEDMCVDDGSIRAIGRLRWHICSFHSLTHTYTHARACTLNNTLSEPSTGMLACTYMHKHIPITTKYKTHTITWCQSRGAL